MRAVIRSCLGMALVYCLKWVQLSCVLSILLQRFLKTIIFVVSLSFLSLFHSCHYIKFIEPNAGCAFARMKRFLFVLWQVPLPSFTNEKEYHKYPGPAAPHDVTPPALFFLPGFPARFAPDRARVCARPKETGFPTGPVSGPWLFSTAEPRTSNSSSCPWGW